MTANEVRTPQPEVRGIRSHRADTSGQWYHAVVTGAGGVVTTLGLLVLAAGYQDPAVFGLFSAIVPQDFSTTFGLLLSGLGLLAVAYEYRRLAFAFATCAVVVGLAALAHHFFGSLQMAEKLPAGTVSGDSVRGGPFHSLLTGACFVFAGIVLLFMQASERHRSWRRALGLAGSVTFTTAVVGLIVHIARIRSSFDWVYLTEMLVLGTAAVAVLGTVVTLILWQSGKADRSGIPHWLSILVSIGALLATLSLWQSLLGLQRSNAKNVLEADAAKVKRRLELAVNSRLDSLIHFATAGVTASPAKLDAQRDNSAISDVSGSLQWLGLVDTGGISQLLRADKHSQTRSSRWEDPKQFLQHLSLDTELRSGLHAASSRLTLTSQNDRLLAVIPVTGGTRSNSKLAGVFDAAEFLETALSEANIRGYHVTLKDKEGELFRVGDGPAEAGWKLETPIDLPGLEWSIVLSPTPAKLAENFSPVPEQALVVGLLMASLLVLQIQLARKTHQRALQIAAINQTLRSEVVERKRAQEALAERERILAAANKELEAFSYSVSHDLRAPLRSIDGFSQALIEDYADKLDGMGKDYLGRVRASAQKMGELIDAMLRLSRITRSELSYEDVDLSELVRSIEADLRQTEPNRQGTILCPEKVPVLGDRRLLRIALENLMGNAWKFTANREEALIEVGVQSGGGSPIYFVRDNGAGFDMAYSNRLFGAFQRLHGTKEFPGTGIGLATVQRIIHRHGGRVWAKAEVDRGATFYFTLLRGSSNGQKDHPAR